MEDDIHILFGIIENDILLIDDKKCDRLIDLRQSRNRIPLSHLKNMY